MVDSIIFLQQPLPRQILISSPRKNVPLAILLVLLLLGSIKNILSRSSPKPCKHSQVQGPQTERIGRKLKVNSTPHQPKPSNKENSTNTQIGNGKKLHACTISGRQIVNEQQSIQCKVCRNFMIACEMNGRVSCPLCHTSKSGTPASILQIPEY